jgi:hypothetical protein
MESGLRSVFKSYDEERPNGRYDFRPCAEVDRAGIHEGLTGKKTCQM